jgi:Transposase DDE domain group 1
MVDATPFLPGLSPVQGKAVVARFDGGRLSSEGGLLVLREIETRLGLADRLAACVKDPRAPERVVHRLAEIIRFRMLMIAAGYEDGNDADSLRADAFHAGFLLSRDNKTSAEPHLGGKIAKPGRNQSRRFPRSAVRLTRPKLVYDQRLDEDRALSDEACLKTRPGDQRAE